MKNSLLRIIIMSCCLLSCSLAHSDWKIIDQGKKGDAEAGKAKTGLCMACHGADGNSKNPIWPSLAGQNRKYLFNQIRDFKLGKNPGGRYDPTMAPLVAALSEQDMLDIASYYESLSLKIGNVKPDYVALGQRIYRGGNLETHVAACIACHGPRGLGNSLAGFPRLSGQQADYIAKQLRDYKNGVRTNGPNNIMQNIAAKMTEAEIIAVAHYVKGLH